MAADPRIVDALTLLHDRHASDQDIIEKQDAEIGRLRAEVSRLRAMVRQHAQSLMEEAQTGGMAAVTRDVLAQLVAPVPPELPANGKQERNPLADSFVL